jgi:hypothetical protein
MSKYNQRIERLDNAIRSQSHRVQRKVPGDGNLCKSPAEHAKVNRRSTTAKRV